jgi:hypothetical protein
LKTNIKLKVNGEYCRVKLDSNKFPYIIVSNEKIIINSIEFPRHVDACHGNLSLDLELISGREELETILSNPALTVDKLSIKQLFRVG